MIEFRAADCGSDGICDTDAGCSARATAVVLSAEVPAGWSSVPRACLAFLCSDHVSAEPIARREDAQHVAQQIGGVIGQALWAQLIATYPNPVALAARKESR